MPDSKPLSPAWIVALVVVVGGAAGLFWMNRRGGGAEEVPPPPKEIEARESTYALLVGCTDYPTLKERYKDRPIHYRNKIYLEGPGHDVDLMQVTLRDYLGVPEANITVLTGWSEAHPGANPTKTNILAWLDDRAAQAKPGDRIIFHFSGHGSQVNDSQENPEETELDGYDEVLLTADVGSFNRTSKGYPGAISDDELRGRLRAIAAAKATVWVSIDCCHAGSMSRGSDSTRARLLDPEDWGAEKRIRSRGGAEIDEDGQALGSEDGIVAFYSVRSYEKAPEKKLPPSLDPGDRTWHGVYTFLLARTLQRYGGAISFAELHAHLMAAYETLPYDSVSPYAHGAMDLRVARDGKASGPPLLLHKEGEQLVLNAGSVRGFAKGTELDIFAPTRDDEAEERLGGVCIVDAGFVSSHCEVIGEGRLNDGSALPARMPARVTRVSEAGFRLYLTVTDGAGKQLAATDYPEALSEFLAEPDDARRVPIVGSDDADWALRVEKEHLRLERLQAGDETPFFAVKPDELGARLRGIMKAQNLRRLVHGDAVAPLPDGLSVQLQRNGHDVDSGTVFQPGDEIKVGITNATDRDWAVTLAVVDANHGVGIILPQEAGEENLIPKQTESYKTKWAGPFEVRDDAQGSECLVVIAVPQEGNTAGYYFWDLESEALEVSRGDGGPRSAGPLLRLAFGEKPRSRGLAPDPEDLAIGQISWRTRWGRFGIPETVRAAGTETSEAARTKARSAQPEASGAPPSPWHVAENLAALPGEGGDTGRAPAVVTWDDAVIQIYVDTDGDAGIDQTGPTQLAERIGSGTLDVELVLRIEAGRRVAWYSPEGREKPFSCVLEDDDGDAQADHRYEWKDGAWQKDASDAHLLATGELGWTPEQRYARYLRTAHALAAFAERRKTR